MVCQLSLTHCRRQLILPIKITKTRTKKNKNISNPKKKKPDKLFSIYAKQKTSKNIAIEIDTSEVIANLNKDIQATVSNQAFLDAVQEAINLWDSVDIADVSFAPLKFASGQVDPEDGKNIISFRATKSDEGDAQKLAVVSVINYARTDNVLFMNKPTMVKAGTILDVDIVYDPANNPCLALHTTMGDFKLGGKDDSPIVEGGINPAVDLTTCEFVLEDDITNLAVISIGSLLGLDSSAIASAATSLVSKIMTRYALTNDDKIGLANIYPDSSKLTNHGIISGKVTLNKKGVIGAHVVLENTLTGEPTISAITDLNGRFKIKAIPAGTYNVYAEPLDGPIRKNALVRNFFGSASDLNFTTGVLKDPITITANKTTKVKIEVREISSSAFNINYLTAVLAEADVNKSGGSFILPVNIMPGETLMAVKFWGDNISKSFGTLSVSGPGVTVSNVQDASIRISPFFTCRDCDDTPTPENPNPKPCKRSPLCAATQELDKEPEQIRGIQADITCALDTAAGPRNIIFTGNQLDPTHPSFGLRDQITGGLFITE